LSQAGCKPACSPALPGFGWLLSDRQQLVPGLQVETVESSCCGMAGAFGYGADTYDVSIAMGELSLLPAVRKADAGTVIVADGTSCRHQIADGTGRNAVHVARVLADSLERAR
jgi:Fe-S oxidoreductase